MTDAGSAAPEVMTTSFVQNDREYAISGYVGDHIFEVVRQTGDFYERKFLDAVGELLPPQPVVIDVGANLGNHSLYFAGVCGGRVVAFEPFGPTADVLARNIADNELLDQVEVHRSALGRDVGHVSPVHVDWANMGATRFAASEAGADVTTLDSVGLQGRVDLIKVDVEGMDVDVLHGARATIERERPIIACEAGDAQVEELDAFLASVGYTYLSRYNPTPTYIALPHRSAQEQVRLQRALISSTSMSHMGMRDLYYRVRLINERLDG